MLKRFYFTVILVVLSLFVVGNCFANVKISDGIYSGMTLEQVKNQIELEKHGTDKGLVSYRQPEEFDIYFFRQDNMELIYKISFFQIQSWDKMMNLLKSNSVCYTAKENNNGLITHFFNLGDDVGVKMSKYNDKAFQIWYGSISRWNELAKENNKLREFPGL